VASEGGTADLSAELAAIQKLLNTDRLEAQARAAALEAAYPQSLQAKLMHGAALSLLQEYDGALRLMQACWDANPSHVAAFNAGYCLRQLGRYEEGLMLLLKGLALPGTPGPDLKALVANTAAVVGDRRFARALLSDDPGPIAAFQRAALGDGSKLTQFTDGDAQDRSILFWMKYDCHLYNEIDNKASLARLLAPTPDATPSYLPESYALPDDRAAALRRLAADDGSWWMLKQANESGGRGLEVLEAPVAGLPDGPARKVVQRLVHPPFLVEGRKVNMRLMMAIQAPRPDACFLWGDGLVYFATDPYELAGGEAAPGLAANWLRVDGELLSKPLGPLPSHVVSFREFCDAVLGARGAELKQAVQHLMSALAADLEARGFFARVHALGNGFLPRFIGMDIGLDADLKPWLFEIERYPGQGRVNPITAGLNTQFRRDWFQLTLAPKSLAADRFVPLADKV